MKKIVVLLVALSIFLAPSFARAASVDLKGMSDSDLMQLNAAIIAELISRGRSAEIPVGNYVVGTHLPAGEYTVTADAFFVIIQVDNAKDAYGSHFQMFSLQKGDTVGRIVLTDGDHVEITGGTVMFQNYSGIVFK